MKKTLSFLLVLAMVLSSFTFAFAADQVEPNAEVKINSPYMKGVGDNTFAPNKEITRQEVATMIARAKGLEAATPEFEDADQIADWAKDCVGALQEKGIVEGDEKGNFNPTAKIDRASLAAMLVRAYEGEVEVGENPFKDVADDAWYAEAVKKAAAAGIVEGDEKGNFNPNEGADRAQTATMVNRMLGLDKLEAIEGIEDVEIEFKDADEWPTWAKKAIIVASTEFSYKKVDGELVLVDEDEEEAIKAAEEAVEKAEESKKQEDIDAARELVEALEDEEVKKELIDRLDAIKVELEVVDVSAINSTQAEVKFNREVKEIKPANFKVTDKDGNLVFVSKVELNETKDVATLSFFDKFVDEGVYTVEVTNVADVDGNVMEKDTAKFEYVKADVAKVEFTQTTVAPGSNLKEAVKITDALGRDVTKEHTVTFETPNVSIVDEDGTVGNVDDESVIVVAVVKDGEKTVKSAKTTIKVSKEAPAKYAGSYVYAEENPASNTKAFNELKDDEKVSYVFKGDKEDKAKKLAVYYVDQYGNDDNEAAKAVVGFNEENQPKLENLTPTVAIVENNGTIKPISVGKAYVKVTQGEIVQVIEIEVKEDSKVATMELGDKDVSVVEGKTDEVKVTFKDQYGNKRSETPEVKIAGKEVSRNDYVEATAKADAIEIKGLKEGTATLEVTYKDEEKKIDLKETINVTVVKAGELAEYKAVVKDVKLDAGNEEGENADKDKAPKSTTITVDKVDTNGNKIGEATNVKLTEVDKDGKEIKDENKKLVTIAEDNKTVTAGKAGKAYIKVSVGTLVIDTVEIEIVNTKSVATSVDFDRQDIVLDDVTVKEDGTVDSGGLDIKAELQKIIKVIDQDGKVMKDTNGEDAKVNADNITIETTNAKGLEVSDNKITKITSANPTVDVVVTEVKEGEENLLKAPTTIKVAVKVGEQDAAISEFEIGDSEYNGETVGKYVRTIFSDKNKKIITPEMNFTVTVKIGDEYVSNKLIVETPVSDKIDTTFYFNMEEKDFWAWHLGEFNFSEQQAEIEEVTVEYIINGIKYSKTQKIKNES